MKVLYEFVLYLFIHEGCIVSVDCWMYQIVYVCCTESLRFSGIMHYHTHYVMGFYALRVRAILQAESLCIHRDSFLVTAACLFAFFL